MRTFFLILVLGTSACLHTAAAQEFNCNVSINNQGLSGSEYTFLNELRDKVREYVNQRRWTDEEFESNERIECEMTIIFTEAVSVSRFRARLVLASRRPIYNTSLKTTVVQFSDDQWTFDYGQGSPLNYEPNRYDPLTSVLDFYVNVMLGYDFDSFSELGGTTYFEEAQRIAETAQGSGAAGWSTIGGDQSRGALISQILDPRFRPLRQAYFTYHFDGLDHFLEDAPDSREAVLDVLKDLAAMRDNVTRSYYLDQFFTAKYQELADLFRQSQDAASALTLLSQMDPAHLSDYTQMAN